MKIKLVFDDWRSTNRPGFIESVYNTSEGVTLSAGDFHHGTTFDATIEVSGELEAELKQALEDGFFPVFALRNPVR